MIRQEINFCRAPPRRDWWQVTPAMMAVAVAMLVAILAVVTGVRVQANQRLRSSESALRNQLASLENQVAALQLQIPEPKPDPALIAEADRQQRAVEELRRLLDAASGDEVVQRHGFSPYFEGLARQTRDDVWLREIRLQHGGRELELAGSALVSESVPKLVQALAAEQAFKAILFSDFVVRRPQQQTGQVNFTLRTWVPREKLDGQP
jgi:type II secretory pathway pseudopilin PulG